jgi:hypothetical protein
MTKLRDRALDAARTLPDETQDEIARIVLALAGSDDASVDLAAEERNAIAASKKATARGDFASEGEVRAVWQKHGL